MLKGQELKKNLLPGKYYFCLCLSEGSDVKIESIADGHLEGVGAQIDRQIDRYLGNVRRNTSEKINYTTNIISNFVFHYYLSQFKHI